MANWKIFLLLTAVLVVADILWIGVLMKSFYDREIGELARRASGSMAPRWGAALFVYLLIPAGIVVFVRPQLVESTTVAAAFGLGAFFGIVVYGVYDLTNLAVLEKWTLRLAAVDMAWGGLLCGFGSLFVRFVDRWTSSP